MSYLGLKDFGRDYSSGSLHQSNISNEEYALIVETWQKEGWTSIKDLFIYYNLLDVAPFI